MLDQMSFFDDFDLAAKRDKAQNLELSVDKIKARYGRFSIVPASLINSDVGIYERFEGGRDEGMFITKPIYAVT